MPGRGGASQPSFGAPLAPPPASESPVNTGGSRAAGRATLASNYTTLPGNSIVLQVQDVGCKAITQPLGNPICEASLLSVHLSPSNLSCPIGFVA